MDKTIYQITIGHPEQDYRIGDFLNALDELVCYFQELDAVSSPVDYANAMILYAEKVKADEV